MRLFLVVGLYHAWEIYIVSSRHHWENIKIVEYVLIQYLSTLLSQSNANEQWINFSTKGTAHFVSLVREDEQKESIPALYKSQRAIYKSYLCFNSVVRAFRFLYSTSRNILATF
jgi:hypothetical protein